MCTGTWRVDKYHSNNWQVSEWNETRVWWSRSVWLSNPPLWQSRRGLWLFPLYELRRSSSILARSPALSPAAGESAGKLAGDGLLSAGDLWCCFFFFLLNPLRSGGSPALRGYFIDSQLLLLFWQIRCSFPGICSKSETVIHCVYSGMQHVR